MPHAAQLRELERVYYPHRSPLSALGRSLKSKSAIALDYFHSSPDPLPSLAPSSTSSASPLDASSSLTGMSSPAGTILPPTPLPFHIPPSYTKDLCHQWARSIFRTRPSQWKSLREYEMDERHKRIAASAEYWDWKYAEAERQGWYASHVYSLHLHGRNGTEREDQRDQREQREMARGVVRSRSTVSHLGREVGLSSPLVLADRVSDTPEVVSPGETEIWTPTIGVVSPLPARRQLRPPTRPLPPTPTSSSVQPVHDSPIRHSASNDLSRRRSKRVAADRINMLGKSSSIAEHCE